MTALSGVWAASLTPVTSDLAPDSDKLVSHVHRLLTDGCDGIVPFGTTGEATSFSVSERVFVLDQIVAAGVDPRRLIVGVGCAAAVDTLELVRSAARHGVAAVLMLPPFYYKAVSDDDLAEAFGWILRTAGSDIPPVLLYNIPQVSGVRVSATLAGRLRDQFPGTVVGVKDSSGDPESLRAFISAMPDGSVFAGTELLLVPGLEDGAVGVISAFANLNAPHIRTAYESRAPADMGPLSDARSALGAHPTIPALKSVIAHRLGDAAWRAVRPPLRALPAEVGATLAAGLPSA